MPAPELYLVSVVLPCPRLPPAELVPPPHRIFLSQATLVVVPPELIDHWRTQVWRGTSVAAYGCLCMTHHQTELPACGALLSHVHPPPSITAQPSVPACPPPHRSGCTCKQCQGSCQA